MQVLNKVQLFDFGRIRDATTDSLLSSLSSKPFNSIIITKLRQNKYTTLLNFYYIKSVNYQ